MESASINTLLRRALPWPVCPSIYIPSTICPHWVSQPSQAHLKQAETIHKGAWHTNPSKQTLASLQSQGGHLDIKVIFNYDIHQKWKPNIKNQYYKATSHVIILPSVIVMKSRSFAAIKTMSD